jgi:hypothetical protein
MISQAAKIWLPTSPEEVNAADRVLISRTQIDSLEKKAA